jgi:hypothetical protein
MSESTIRIKFELDPDSFARAQAQLNTLSIPCKVSAEDQYVEQAYSKDEGEKSCPAPFNVGDVVMLKSDFAMMRYDSNAVAMTVAELMPENRVWCLHQRQGEFCYNSIPADLLRKM